MRPRVLAALAVSLGLSTGATAAEIVRCAGPAGITYQHGPCAESQSESRPAIPSEFPPANAVERERLLAREAALDRRLEARRDRELQEHLARTALQQREAEVEMMARIAAAEPPFYGVAYPYWQPAFSSSPVRGVGAIRGAPRVPRPTNPIVR
jgi:hypothetical protein